MYCRPIAAETELRGWDMCGCDWIGEVVLG